MSGMRTQIQMSTKFQPQRKAIVDNFCRARTDRLVKNKWVRADQWARHINDALSLVVSAPPLAGGIWINCNDQHCAIRLDPARRINDTLPLAGAADALPLAGAALPLAVSIRIKGNDLHCAIWLDLVLNLHDLDRKHNAKGIYHNNIMPPAGSSIYCYQVRKKVVPRHDAIRKQGNTWLSHLFNSLTKQY